VNNYSLNRATGIKDCGVKTQRIGDVLLDRGIINQKQLEEALEIQKKENRYVGEILEELGYIEDRDVVTALVVQCHLPYIAIDKYEISPAIIQLVPKAMACRYTLIPLDRVGDVLSVVMVNPLDTVVQEELQKMTHCKIVPFIAERLKIESAIKRCYKD